MFSNYGPVRKGMNRSLVISSHTDSHGNEQEDDADASSVLALHRSLHRSLSPAALLSFDRHAGCATQLAFAFLKPDDDSVR